MDDVAADTRIRATLIEAIESDHFDPCGGTVYARGHIRSIAKVVGVDPEAVIGEFDAAHNIEHVAPTAVVAATTDHEIVSRSERRQPNWTLAMAAALVVICGLALVGLLHNTSGGSPSPRANPPVHVGTKRSSPPASPPPSSVAQLPSSRATMLVRTLSGRTWLSITTKAGKSLYSGVLEPGQHRVFSDRHGLAYIIGNAPAVDLVVNGNDIGSPPSSNVVARGSIVPGKGTVQQA